jgi:mannose-6-phosphate isomerase-like protein (cupin superfamily)
MLSAIPGARPSTKAEAEAAFRRAGYPCLTLLARKGSAEGRDGFWDAAGLLDARDARCIHFGPGEYLRPHMHDEAETFHVRGGSATVWCLDAQAPGKCPTWVAQMLESGQTLEIPAGTPHCLRANAPHGLTMHVPRDDSTRSVEFLPQFMGPPLLSWS